MSALILSITPLSRPTVAVELVFPVRYDEFRLVADWMGFEFPSVLTPGPDMQRIFELIAKVPSQSCVWGWIFGGMRRMGPLQIEAWTSESIPSPRSNLSL